MFSRFVMKYENIEFGEALRILAEKAGIELRHENPAEYRYTGLLYDLNESAKAIFQTGARGGADRKRIFKIARAYTRKP